MLRIIFYFFYFKVLLFFLHINSSSPPLSFSCPPLTPFSSSHPLLRVRPSFGSQRSLAYQVKAGPSPPYCVKAEQGKGNVRQKASSWSWNRSWCHCQPEQLKPHNCHQHSEGWFGIMWFPQLSVHSPWTPISSGQLSLWFSPSCSWTTLFIWSLLPLFNWTP